MQPGIRVLRGPDWCYSNQDGGPGFLGTVVKFLSNKRVVVVWDIGTVTECRAGPQGSWDLRVYDNAQIGVKQVICDGACLDTDDNTDYGFRWKDIESEDTDQCTPCYMRDLGEPGHAYVRYTTRKSLVEKVMSRRKSRSIPLFGILPGAVVVESTASKQDGQTGTVKELINFHESYRGAVTVEWKSKPTTGGCDEDPELPIYRLGADGKVELKLVTPSPEKHQVYIDHLPVLDLTQPLDIEFHAGDRVRMDLNLETFKALQSEYGGWTEEMESIMGEEGIVEKVLDEPRRIAAVKFVGYKTAWAIYMNTMTKLEYFRAGDYVRITDNIRMATKALTGDNGWQDCILAVLGQVGRIEKVDTSGTVHITVQEHTYTLPQSCLQELKEEEKRIFLSVGVGVRVVRGPDWKPDFGDQDGGEGHLGSIVEIGGQNGSVIPANCVVVQWDMGQRNIYRAGYDGAYDLRIFDSAGIGIKHNAQCSECRTEDISGIIWKDAECDNINLCSECYSSDRQHINHQFIRINCPTMKGVLVPKRSTSKKLTAKGIFERSKVKRGPNWRWQNQDGGQDKTGEVIAIVNFSPDSDRDASEVTWECGYTNVYRLGYSGNLDVLCMQPSSGGYYYPDHLPVFSVVQLLGSKRGKSAHRVVGAQTRFKGGDKVRIQIDHDVLRTIEGGKGSWNDMMTKCIGKTGRVKMSNMEGDVVVDFGGCGIWTFSEMSLSEVKEFIPGETVLVNKSIETVKQIQENTVGWNDLMEKVIGKRGKVEEVDEDGDILVSFGKYSWTFNEECLTKDKGKPDVVLYNQETEEPSEEGNNNMAPEDMTVNKLFDAIEKGDNELVERLVCRKPNLLTEKHQGKCPMHWACYRGELEIVTTLISSGHAPDIIELTDDEGCTPILAAVKGRQLRIVQKLAELGADKEAKTNMQKNAVHLAVSNTDIAMLRFLREHGFNVNQQDIMKQTPVFEAIQSDNQEVAKIILGWPGVNIQCLDTLGFSPFFLACRKGDIKIVNELLKMSPGELNSVKTDGFTGLHIAVLNGNADLVQFLLSQSCIQFDLPTVDGRTPLMIACSEGHIDIAKMLIDKGSGVKAVDKKWRNCLHHSVLVLQDQEGKTDEQIMQLAQLLITRGISHDKKDSNGKTPIELASESVKSELAMLVLQRDQQIKKEAADQTNNSAAHKMSKSWQVEKLPPQFQPKMSQSLTVTSTQTEQDQNQSKTQNQGHRQQITSKE